jgi:hypothetical protein
MNRLRNQENNSIHNSLLKILGINLTKEVKDLYSENDELLKKSKTLKVGKISHVHRSAESIL